MKTLPAQYAKFITALLGAAIGYLTAYGPVWNLQGALVMAAVPLAVLGVPNAAPAAAVVPPAQPSNVTVVQPGASTITPAGPLS